MTNARKMMQFALAPCVLLTLTTVSLAVRAPTPPLKARVSAAETVFLGKLVNKVVTGEWASAELLVEEPLRNAKKGEKTKVIWRIKLGRFQIYDVPQGTRGIAILKDRHQGRYWLRGDKFESPDKLVEIKGFIGSAPSKQPKNASPAGLARANTAFAVKLYRQMSAKEGNLFFSPYSISSALGMTYGGARGETDKEMKAALNFELDQAELHAAFKKLNAELANNARSNGQKLNIANGLCLTGDDVSKEFKTLLQDNYGAELFRGGLAKINGWVKEKTEGKIDKILSELSPDSVCVILNAIYFKGAWATKFKEKRTRIQPFKVSATKRVNVPLMYLEGEFKLLKKKGFQIAALPYKGDELSMIVLLPDAAGGTASLQEQLRQLTERSKTRRIPKPAGGLAALEKQLTAANLALWLGELDKTRKRTVWLYLPRFKLETDYDLVGPFKKLGMKNAFDANADFSGMGWPKGKLWISQIKHKAFVEVNEEGTEAAAATAVEITTESAVMYPTFRADHPFIYLIRDNKTGSILFLGRMANPLGS